MSPNHTRPKLNRILKVVLLGDGGVGKSSLMRVYVEEKFDPRTSHTVGVEFLKKDIQIPSCQKPVTLQIWDTAGQEKYKSLRTPFYRGSDACLLTFAVDDEKSFERLSYWKGEFLNYSNVADPSTFPFVVIGNKIDVSDRRVSTQQAERWCREQKIPYFETSAKDIINVDSAFFSAAERALELEKNWNIASRNTIDTINLKKHTNSGTGCC